MCELHVHKDTIISRVSKKEVIVYIREKETPHQDQDVNETEQFLMLKLCNAQNYPFHDVT